ncbi:RagB/SusD family nutrient uptake outer membrane protein [Dysgonomonas sp. BGC7]|uniref:RagB/SusD family nutrient uptake outer membrane protein n=1 Tax=Dysgonomonas sp. BGC7 TaxID=1658008 RepID=UPI0006826B1C|nr:RagB/SusD family nutrient uptake outer membrane protein [Dysgonomonas sp. BGC7]MBD8387128.1 RagB/SusD family nutrient uptake outer membrane protein [Dysgonomonas sp. BGC7]
MKKNYNIFLILLLAITFFSCEDWLDVSPKTEIKSEDNFNNEQGYKDALTGIYLLMTDESLYGCETTYGMLDALAQYYNSGIGGTSHKYYYDYQFAYTEASTKGRIDAIWGKAYNAIANTNELISHINSAAPSMFTGNNYSLIRGEAYGLRAFLHFDILRLFAKTYASDSKAKAIPYVTSMGKEVNLFVTVEKAAEMALADLKIAEEMLKQDAVVAVNSTDDEKKQRTFKFNYYAVKMLQARIYLFINNTVEANRAAQEIISQKTFYWTPASEITSTTASSRNRIFSRELVFSLYISDLTSLYTEYFTTMSGLYMSDAAYNAIYQLTQTGYSSDYRYVYQTTQLSDGRFSIKYEQPSNGVSDYKNRIPLMRISEAYYIAAECALNNDDVPTAIGYLNIVRGKRNITNTLETTVSKTVAEEELYKEYAKEFYAEGQLYYFFKRRNYSQIPVKQVWSDGYESVTMVTPNYIFPLPDDEIEFGDGK